ncbi:MAG: corA [Paenibacillus sp.]|nr:corA [Paenibacillus sp.]
MLLYNSTSSSASVVDNRVPEQDEVAWVHLSGAPEAEVRHVLVDLFDCHPLIVEDCLVMNQRPKLDRYKNNIFIVFYALLPDLKVQEIAIVIGPNYVISMTQEDLPYIQQLTQECEDVENGIEHPGQILYHLLDRCVDEYSERLNHADDRIDKMERAIFKNPHVKVAQNIFKLKRTLHLLRAIFVEERTVLGSISHQTFPYTRQESDVYFVDIYDHLSRVIDTVDIFRESLNGLLELQMNMKTDRMNEIIKTLTIVSTIFMPLTFIVGIYGMNFHKMPELDWSYGYLFVWGVMLALSLGMWAYFKSKKWL